MLVKEAAEKGILSARMCDGMSSLGLVCVEELLSVDLGDGRLAHIGPLTQESLAALQSHLQWGKDAVRLEDNIEDFGSDPETARRIQEHVFRLQGMPEDLSGQTFLDVGCWEGWACVEAQARGSTDVVGLDLVAHPSVLSNSQVYGFEFFPCDALSEKFLALPRFDVVSCAGVLYHVESPISLLRHLRKVTAEQLYLDTICLKADNDQSSLLSFHAGASDDDGISMWFVPTTDCVQEMLGACGFKCTGTSMIDSNSRYDRFCFCCTPTAEPFLKSLPRKRRFIKGTTRPS